jgi:L,D-peptidoglycan transpeptidase YkuD (ErfK/YbiS/YcfS/YnhG family)
LANGIFVIGSRGWTKKVLIVITSITANTTCGRLLMPGSSMKCALGRGGIRPRKREGDGATPAGVFDIRRLFYRPDRLQPPATLLPVTPLAPNFGWCDDPASPRYNQLVRLPFQKSHEKMWRSDNLYDIVVELGFNDSPVIRGQGSAIFLHVAGPDYAPTEGCIAVSLDDMHHLAAQLKPGDRIKI